jgi:tRNA(Met) C34 N-acetyltransferase TmcA
MTEVVHTGLRFRNQVPDAHRKSLDTRIMWLWNQRFGTVQMVWQQSRDMLDRTAATLILQAIFAKDLEAIAQIFERIEGGAQFDVELSEKDARITRV